MKISLCMIVRDEEAVLARCLESVKGAADEIVIVDTGSSDKTAEIAKAFTDKLFSFPWCDDFAEARNFAFSKAEGDYLFWLDADDVIPPESHVRLGALRALLEEEQPDTVMCPYDVGFLNGRPSATFYRERFLKRSENFRWVGRVHECIPPHGKIVREEFHIHHLGSDKPRGRRNLHIYQKWAAEERLSPRDLFYYGRELQYNGLFTEAIAVLEEMLQGDGWTVNKIEACKSLSRAHEGRGERDPARTALLRSFLYGEPRASVCCELGRLFFEDRRFLEAIFWYQTAIGCRDHSRDGDFEEPACRGLVPLLQLVVCYYRLGDRDKAKMCHQKTEELAPEHPSVIYNRKFFSPSNEP